MLSLTEQFSLFLKLSVPSGRRSIDSSQKRGGIREVDSFALSAKVGGNKLSSSFELLELLTKVLTSFQY
jgi:hypothetical protein